MCAKEASRKRNMCGLNGLYWLSWHGPSGLACTIFGIINSSFWSESSTRNVSKDAESWMYSLQHWRWYVFQSFAVSDDSMHAYTRGSLPNRYTHQPIDEIDLPNVNCPIYCENWLCSSSAIYSSHRMGSGIRSMMRITLWLHSNTTVNNPNPRKQSMKLGFFIRHILRNKRNA